MNNHHVNNSFMLKILGLKELVDQQLAHFAESQTGLRMAEVACTELEIEERDDGIRIFSKNGIRFLISESESIEAALSTFGITGIKFDQKKEDAFNAKPQHPHQKQFEELGYHPLGYYPNPQDPRFARVVYSRTNPGNTWVFGFVEKYIDN